MCVCVHVSVSPVFSYTPQEWEAVSGRAGIQLTNQSIDHSIDQYLIYYPLPGGQKQQLKGFRGLYVVV